MRPPGVTLFPYTTLFRSDDAPVIDDQRIGDHGVDRTLLVGGLRLSHAVADHLAAAELHLFAVNGEILFEDRKSTRLNSSHRCISYAVFCLKKKMARAQNV